MFLFAETFSPSAWAAPSARDGDGTAAVSPASTTGGSAGNGFAFSFRNGTRGNFNAGSQFTLRIPAGWTAPQGTNSSLPGYVGVVSTTGTASAAFSSVTGSGPWIATVNFTASRGVENGFDLEYAGGGNKVVAPATTGIYAFVAQTRQNGGTLTAIASSPSITVYKGNQTLSFPSIDGQWTTNRLGLDVTASSGLAVGLAVVSGPGSLVGTNLTFTGAGTVSIVATQPGDANWNPAPAATQTISVVKAVAGVSLESMIQTYDGTAREVSAATVPSGLAVNFTYGGSSTPPVAAGSYAVAAAINDGMFQGSASGILVVAKAPAAVALSGLAQTYDGAPKVATATTDPAGLGVEIAYDGSTTAPAAAGSYAVVAAISDPNHVGSATGTLVVAKAPAVVSLSGLAQTYDGAPKTATATTDPAGLGVEITYDGSPAAPTAVGSYAVVAAISDPNHVGSAAGTLVVAKAPATVSLSGLAQTYDGAPKTATATTEPTGLGVEITYDGSSTAPTAAGSYAVVAAISDPNHVGSVTGTLVVAKRIAGVVLAGLTQTYDGAPKVATATTDPAGLGVEITYDGSSTAPTSVGSYEVVATVQDSNCIGGATGMLEVAKAAAVVVLGDLDQYYDGGPKSATATTEPPGLSVDVTYDGNPIPPTEIGQYGVTAVINDPSHAGSATGMLLVVPQVELQDLAQVYDGNPKPVKTRTTPTGVTVTVTYDGHPLPPVNAGCYAVTAMVCRLSCKGRAHGTLMVAKAGQSIEFPPIGNQLSTSVVALSATASSGLPASFSVASGPAAVDGTTLSFSGTGRVSIAASQAGDGNWAAAPETTQTFDVVRAPMGLLVNQTNVYVREGGEGRFFIRLNQDPGKPVTVNISHDSGSESIAIQRGAAQTFNSTCWSNWQSVTLAQVDDGNIDEEAAAFRVSAAGMADQLVEAASLDDDIDENLALAARGSTIVGWKASNPAQLIDGVHTSSANYGHTIWTNNPPGKMTLDLRTTATVSRVRLLNWDWSYRPNRYRIESSVDSTNWLLLADASADGHSGWEEWDASGRAIRYLRFTGTSNSVNQCVLVSELEVYGVPAPLPLLEFSTDTVHVREGGEGRFFVRMNYAPTSNVVVRVVHSAGDTNLTVKSGAARSFGPTTWNQWQAVTLAAPEDGNGAGETAIFCISTPGMDDRFVTADALDDEIGENLALASGGSTIKGTRASAPAQLIDGVHAFSTNYGYTAWTGAVPGTITLDLQSPAMVSRVRLLNWDWVYRIHRYRIESSLDGAAWSLLADASDAGRQGWDDWAVSNQLMRYVRFTGLSNSANSYVLISELEVYGIHTPLPEPELSRTALNVHEAGEGRFFIRLTSAPPANVVFTVSRSAGSTSLAVLNGASRTFNRANWNAWQLVTLGASGDANADDETATFRISAPGFADSFVTATALDDDIGENLALASGGATISGYKAYVLGQMIDGCHNSKTNFGYSMWTNNPRGTITVDLKDSMTVSRVRLLNYDWTYRTHRYTIESSPDGTTWSMLVDAGGSDRQGWDDWPVANQAMRYVRFTGLSNSFSEQVRISEFEIYGTRAPARRSLASAKSVPALDSGSSAVMESEPVTVVTSDDVAPAYESGWAAVDGDPETAWTGQKTGGGYIAIEYGKTLELSALEVDVAEGSLPNIQYLYSMDAQEWQPLPENLEENPVSLKFLWLVFPDDDTATVPSVIEIRPNP